MDTSSTPQWEQEPHAPVRACHAKDGGGAPGPSTVKRKREMVKNFEEMVWFSLPPDAGPGDAPKGVSPDLGRGADPSLCVILC